MSAKERAGTVAIPRVDLKAQWRALAHELSEAFERVMASGSYILGAETEAFESGFASYCGARHCVTTGSGTDAIRLALKACEIGTGDEVLTVSLTYPATAFAIELCGARAEFVDISADTYTIDPDCVARAISSSTRAVLPVHLYGQCADMAPLQRLAGDHGLHLVEDAAQAHGATYNGRRAGSLGTAGCFSFYPTKNLGAYGDGGAIVTDDSDLAQKARILRDHGRTEASGHVHVTGSSRLDEVQAALLRVKLRHLEEWNAARSRLAGLYSRLLADLPLTLPVADARGEHAFHLYVVRTPYRDDLRAHLRHHGVEAGVHFATPVHRQPVFTGRVTRAELPQTESCAGEVLSLPMYPELSETAVERVAEIVQAFFD